MDEEYFRLMTAATRFGGKSFEDPSNIVKSENIPLNTMIGMEYPSLQQLTTSMTPTHAQLLNPIDRLYSMQNSYFCGPDNGATPPGSNGSDHHSHHPGSSALHHHQGSPPNGGTPTGPGLHHPHPPGPPTLLHPGHPLHPLQQQHQHHLHHHQQQQQP
ncbi:hypothetical protein RP20_CCG028367 [Aedes albopictus]|nr:hypothetical protein RP20_CCG028367 [Aedes albopictus]